MADRDIQPPPPPTPALARNLLALIDSPDLAWEPMRPGIEIFRLHQLSSGGSAALLRYAAGAKLPRHRHVAMEHIYVLRGSQMDDNGLHTEGTLLVHYPGTSHTVSSVTGCIVLAIWEKPVVFEAEA